jgi:hypothetical protein
MLSSKCCSFYYHEYKASINMFLMILMDSELETTFFMTGCYWDLFGRAFVQVKLCQNFIEMNNLLLDIHVCCMMVS